MTPNGLVIGEPSSTEVTIIETTSKISKLLTKCYVINITFIALTVEFDSATYTAPENSLIQAGLVLSGGSFSSRITVAVTPSEQSPVSARGTALYSITYIYPITYYIQYRWGCRLFL